MIKELITVLIPSYNRKELLEALVEELVLKEGIEIIVISNKEIKTKQWLEAHNVLFIPNESRGSSNCRNMALPFIKNSWIIFLDDDVQIPTGFFDTAKQIIESEQFDCFGGMYYPWYPIGDRPRWLAEDFGKKPPLTTKTAPINVLKDGCLSAGVMAVKTTALQTIGGFRTDLGMTNTVGYGEEDDMQIRLQAAGYRMGFVPDWFLYHAVLPHKQKVGWHLRAAHARARDAQRIYNKNTKTQIIVFLLQLIPFTILVKIPRSLFRLVFKKDYYWQNAVLDSIQSIYSNIGKLQAVFTTTSPAPKKDEE